MSLTPATRLGQYVITAQIGLGGMGEVYSATDTVLKRQVAVKVLPDALAVDGEGLARLRREAEVLASLNHPNLAAIYGLEQAKDPLALVMELPLGWWTQRHGMDTFGYALIDWVEETMEMIGSALAFVALLAHREETR